MKTSLLNTGALINEITKRLESGEYKDFASTGFELEQIRKGLLMKAVDLSDSAVHTLITEKFIKIEVCES